MNTINKWDYSCWIDPDNQVRNKVPEKLDQNGEESPFQQGYVQVSYKNGSTMHLSGTLTAIKQSRTRWIILASTVSTIELDLIDATNNNPLFSDAPTFRYPEELPDLDKFIAE